MIEVIAIHIVRLVRQPRHRQKEESIQRQDLDDIGLQLIDGIDINCRIYGFIINEGAILIARGSWFMMAMKAFIHSEILSSKISGRENQHNELKMPVKYAKHSLMQFRP